MNLRTAPLAAVLLACAAPCARADDGALRFGLAAGWADFSFATQSVAAVLDGGRGAPELGLFAERGLGRDLEIALSLHGLSRTGERAFATGAASPVYRLGHPLRLRRLTADMALGWRFSHGTWAPVVSAGPAVVWWSERSDVGGETDTVSVVRLGARLAARVERPVGSWIAGVEVAVLAAPGVLDGGLARVYDEGDAGGLTVALRVGFGGRP